MNLLEFAWILKEYNWISNHYSFSSAQTGIIFLWVWSPPVSLEPISITTLSGVLTTGQRRRKISAHADALVPGSVHTRPPAHPPIDMSGNFPAHMSAESPSSPPFPQKSYPQFRNHRTTCGNTPLCLPNYTIVRVGREGPQFLVLCGILILLLLRASCQVWEPYDNFWNYTPFPPKNAKVRGVGGVPDCLLLIGIFTRFIYNDVTAALWTIRSRTYSRKYSRTHTKLSLAPYDHLALPMSPNPPSYIQRAFLDHGTLRPWDHGTSRLIIMGFAGTWCHASMAPV